MEVFVSFSIVALYLITVSGADLCTVYNFESGIDNLDTKSCLPEFGPWDLVYYVDLPTNSPNELSSVALAASSLNCYSTNTFPMMTGGTLQFLFKFQSSDFGSSSIIISIYDHDNFDDPPVDQIFLHHSEFYPDADWINLSYTIERDILNGYITLMAIIDAGTMALVDSFRYYESDELESVCPTYADDDDDDDDDSKTTIEGFTTENFTVEDTTPTAVDDTDGTTVDDTDGTTVDDTDGTTVDDTDGTTVDDTDGTTVDDTDGTTVDDTDGTTVDDIDGSTTKTTPEENVTNEPDSGNEHSEPRFNWIIIFFITFGCVLVVILVGFGCYQFGKNKAREEIPPLPLQLFEHELPKTLVVPRVKPIYSNGSDITYSNGHRY